MKDTSQEEEKLQAAMVPDQEDDYFTQAIKERLNAEKLSLDDMPLHLGAEFKKLVATLAMEKSGDNVDNILIIGRAANKWLKTFLAATDVALEIAGHSTCKKRAKGGHDLAQWLRNPDTPSKTTLHGVNSRKYRHILIRDLEVFPFDEGTGASDFTDIEKDVRILATTSPDAQQQLPQDINEKFRIQVDLDRKRIINPNFIPENAETKEQIEALQRTDWAYSTPRNFGIGQPETLVTTDSAAAIHPGFETWPEIEKELGHSRHSIEGKYGYAERCKVEIKKNLKKHVFITKEDAEKIKKRFPPKPPKRKRPRKS